MESQRLIIACNHLPKLIKKGEGLIKKIGKLEENGKSITKVNNEFNNLIKKINSL